MNSTHDQVQMEMLIFYSCSSPNLLSSRMNLCVMLILGNIRITSPTTRKLRKMVDTRAIVLVLVWNDFLSA